MDLKQTSYFYLSNSVCYVYRLEHSRNFLQENAFLDICMHVYLYIYLHVYIFIWYMSLCQKSNCDCFEYRFPIKAIYIIYKIICLKTSYCIDASILKSLTRVLHYTTIIQIETLTPPIHKPDRQSSHSRGPIEDLLFPMVEQFYTEQQANSSPPR